MSEKMTTDEPTTEEVVRNFRGAHIFGITQALENRIADRLESQEQTIAELMVTCETMHQEMQAMIDCHKPNLDKIAALTARAEKAERERDALISSIERLRTKKIELCSICEFEDMIGCAHKNHCTGYQNFKWRGLPQ